jgi:hypothetical protein
MIAEKGALLISNSRYKTGAKQIARKCHIQKRRFLAVLPVLVDQTAVAQGKHEMTYVPG